MPENWALKAEAICFACGGHCCNEAHPPVSSHRYGVLLAAGIPESSFERTGYLRVRTKPDGTCLLMNDHRCTCHSVKPETCRAGPFTFDVADDRIRIFLKHPSICPIVPLLCEEPAAYRQQFEKAVISITDLVSHLTREEIAAINAIEEPETDLVAEIAWSGSA